MSARPTKRRGRTKAQTLTKALSALLGKTLLPDLRERAGQASVERSLRDQWRTEKTAGHTAARFEAWRDQLVEQVGAAWILSCVFVRTLEDRDLLDTRRLAGPGAADSEQLFFELAPALGYRDYLLTVFREVARLPGAEALLGPTGNPAWRLSPSEAAVRALLGELREEDEARTPKWRFEPTEEDDGTRFLGDLYQDLSEAVRKRYALLQTPDFVESFILDRTLDPAIAEFGLDAVRLIDPTCGSGHFLLGAFARLFDARQVREPGGDPRAHALAALAQVYGVDLNPYAVAIARFRLTLAWLDAAGVRRLSEAPRLPLNLAVADSLLHGARAVGGAGGENLRLSMFAEEDAAWGDKLFALEDVEAAERIFRQRYHAVVGNPPYITCKDRALREAYRERYASAAGKYALSAPFCERLFQLAVDEGFTGQITANSFMKREFGKKLVQDVLPHLDLTGIIDASGAYIPGHGTPTVLLFGRTREPVGAGVVAVLGKRGEPSTPDDPAEGLVWSSIAGHAGDVGYEDEFLSVAELTRDKLREHPWSLGGGGAAELKERLEAGCERTLGEAAESIGYTTICGDDPVFILEACPLAAALADACVPLVYGEAVRDWSLTPLPSVVFPYESLSGAPHEPAQSAARHLWRYRALLRSRTIFSKTLEEKGEAWFGHMYRDVRKLRTPLSITFAFVATHNHFVLERGGKVFKQSAPIIKLPPDASEDDHLALLGYLNSSTACFWMKQVFYPKATAVGDISTDKGREENNRYEFAGTGLKPLPLPPRRFWSRITALVREMDKRVAALSLLTPDSVLSDAVRTGELLESRVAAARAQREVIEQQMMVLQEELDWLIYEAFGLVGPQRNDTAVDGIRGEDRPFLWSDRLGPPDVPDALRTRYTARRETLVRDPLIGMLETPVYKRLWLGTRGVFGHKAGNFDDRVRDAADRWLLDFVERLLAGLDAPATCADVAVRCASDPSFQAVLAWRERGDSSGVRALLAALVATQSVPFTVGQRLSPSGHDKHAVWQRTWDLQRREDAGESVGEIPVPPKYSSKDYASPTCWRLRGKLDVPKERFISYPGAERDDDPSPIIGWAGWDHLQRAQALASLYHDRKDVEGWAADRLTPLLAGLLELVPWLKQWHNDPDPDYDGLRMGDYFASFVDGEARELGLTLDDLRAWRPAKRSRRRKGGKA